MRILLVDDHRMLVDTLKYRLQPYFNVTAAYCGEEADKYLMECEYDIVVLDMVLPDICGIEICRQMRDDNVMTPVLMISGKDCAKKRVEALNSGVDDFLHKPFQLEELLARINAILRRSKNMINHVLEVGKLTLNTKSMKVKRDGVKIELRKKELLLLELFMRNSGQVLSRNIIYERVWGSEKEFMTNTIDVHVKMLRDKIDRPFKRPLIKTVFGLGYKLEK